MSRWSRKTQEEKNAVAAKIMAQKKFKGQLQWVSGLANEIYDSGYIPIQCPKCGWSFCYSYVVQEVRDDELYKVDPNMAFNSYITGNCAGCEKFLKRTIPSTLTAEFAVYSIVAERLSKLGKMTDDREKIGNIYWKRHGRQRR
jgi:hypothetical protein